MQVTTGFGYFVKDGKKLRKYEFPIGKHQLPDGYSYVEVANQKELDAILLDKTDEQIARETHFAKMAELKQSAIKKLTDLGLSTEEISAFTG